MGKIELDHTGSGSGITLSSDGTDLLLDGTAIGGGGGSFELIDENRTGTYAYTAPSATGDNAIAIGNGATASGLNLSTAIGYNATASNSSAMALMGTASGSQSTSMGHLSSASAGQSMALGLQTSAGAASSVALGRYATTATNDHAMALGRSYASGLHSLAAAISTNSSSYGATGAYSIALGYQSKAEDNNAIALNGGRADGSGALAWSTSARARFSRSIALGYNAYANADNAIAIGTNALSDVKGKVVFSNFTIAPTYSQGSAQSGQYTLGCQTSDATATTMTSDNSATANSLNQVKLHDHEAVAFEILLVGRQDGTDGSDCAAWKIMGLIKRASGAANTTLVNSSTTVIDNTPSWGTPALSADTTNGCLKVQVTGAASTDIAWVATVTTSELTHS